MAYDKGLVGGEIIDIVEGEKFDVVVVLDKSKPKFPNEVACEFVGKSRELVRELRVGDWISVEGSIRSKRSQKTGHYFTNFVCYSVGQIDLRSAAGRAQHHETKAPPPPPADDDLAF